MVEITQVEGAADALNEYLENVLDEAASTLGHQFDQPPVNFEATDDDGNIFGGLTGYPLLGWLFVKYFAVSPAARGTGLGRQLLARAEDEAQVRDLMGVYLDTFDFQAPAFYEKLGYKEIGRLPAVDGHPARIWYCKTTGDRNLTP